MYLISCLHQLVYTEEVHMYKSNLHLLCVQCHRSKKCAACLVRRTCMPWLKEMSRQHTSYLALPQHPRDLPASPVTPCCRGLRRPRCVWGTEFQQRTRAAMSVVTCPIPRIFHNSRLCVHVAKYLSSLAV